MGFQRYVYFSQYLRIIFTLLEKNEMIVSVHCCDIHLRSKMSTLLVVSRKSIFSFFSFFFAALSFGRQKSFSIQFGYCLFNEKKKKKQKLVFRKKKKKQQKKKKKMKNKKNIIKITLTFTSEKGILPPSSESLPL